MNQISEVHWHEGMFLRPHHFQIAFSGMQSRLHNEIDRVRPWNYGVSKIKINEGLLAQNIFEITSCEIIYPDDGAIVCVPDNVEVPQRSFRDIVQTASCFDVYLGLPRVRQRDVNVSLDETRKDCRYLVKEEAYFDENSGQNSQHIQTKSPNVQILFEGESLSGYSVVKIARIHPTGSIKGTPSEDPSFVPASLSIGSSDLLLDMVRTIVSEALAASTRLSRQLVDGELLSGSATLQGVGNTLRLQSLRRGTAVLEQMVNLASFHPQEVYFELLRTVADLSVFGPPNTYFDDLPAYDHDDLWKCFQSTIDALRNLLDVVSPRQFHFRPFVERDQILECTLEREWLEPTARLYIAVKSSEYTREEIQKFMNLSAVKVASPTKLVEIDSKRTSGIPMARLDRVIPGELPQMPDGEFYELKRKEGADQFWDMVGRELRIAISGARLEEGISYILYVVPKPTNFQ